MTHKLIARRSFRYDSRAIEPGDEFEVDDWRVAKIFTGERNPRADYADEAHPHNVEMVKRGRGRPRKYPVASLQAEEEQPKETAAAEEPKAETEQPAVEESQPVAPVSTEAVHPEPRRYHRRDMRAGNN